MSELTARQQAERAHHDRWAEELDPNELLVEASFEAPTALENGHALKWMGALHGKRILDLGAGAGEASLYFASHGAEVTAVDISQKQLDVLAAAARVRGLEVRTLAIAAEQLPFEDQSFDCVYANGVLHHVDIQTSIPEVKRVLKAGGRAVFIEPLAYNPAIWVYRHMASDVRTPDEKPLRKKQIDWVVRQFARGSHHEFWITGLSLFVYFWLGEGVRPSDDRYWKKVLRDGERYRDLVKPLFAVDRVLARVPGVRMLAWNTVICVER